jgi:hypothetical protein
MMERNLAKKPDDAYSAILGFISYPVAVMDPLGLIVASNLILANQKPQGSTACGKLENKYCYETFSGGSTEVCEECGLRRVFEAAIDAMPDDGKIIVDRKEVKGGLEISFADTGIGKKRQNPSKTVLAPLHKQGTGHRLWFSNIQTHHRSTQRRNIC